MKVMGPTPCHGCAMPLTLWRSKKGYSWRERKHRRHVCFGRAL